MRNYRLLIVFVMVFVGLMALVAIQNAQPKVIITTPTPGVSDAYVFSDITFDQLQAVRLRSPETGKTFLLNRTAAGTWEAPVNPGTLNQTNATDIAKTMILLPYGETVPLQAGADKTIYGFTPEGVLSIEILLDNGATHVVAVGYRTPSQDRYYALVDDQPNLYLVERAPIDYLIGQLKSPPVS